LSSALEELLKQTQVGTLAEPPSAEQLAQASRRTNSLLAESLPPQVWQSTQAVDAALSHFCRGLYPDWMAYRRRRRQRAGAA